VKTLEWWGSRGYLFEPMISFVLSNHNMSGPTVRIVDELRKFSNSEIIVIDDGSEHGHTKAIVDHLTGVNEFVVHANDLFDVIVFNRTFEFARGKFIVVLQDDDKYTGTSWVTGAIDIFNGDPRMAVLGGRSRVVISADGKRASMGTGPFQYAQVVNAAPMWVRRDAFMKLGGFDNEFAPMLWHEGDLCLRAWQSGYHVGWYRSGVSICAVRARDRRKSKEELAASATKKNFEILMSKHGHSLDTVYKMVREENARIGIGLGK